MNRTLYSWRPEEGGEGLDEQYVPLRPLQVGGLTAADRRLLIRAYLHSGQRWVGGGELWEVPRPRDSALTVYLVGPASPWREPGWLHQSWWYRFCFENYRADRLAAECGVEVRGVDGGHRAEWFAEADCLGWSAEQVDGRVAAVLRWHVGEAERLRELARERFTDPPHDPLPGPGVPGGGGG